ncbi:MAG: class I SAM-dependent methyltransferase [Acidobacteriia bacterium]|nr:class I SAM-dependent methyltransferase [Terriglobia bacterium]
MSTEKFYDDLVPYYDLIFPDWNESMARQGDALARVIREGLHQSAGASPRVLDAAAGIGTQALPLAARGFRVTARDLSPQAIARLTREAAARGLSLDAGVADMRAVGATVNDRFDAVLCCDNSLPHLLTDADIAAAFSEFQAVLIEGGVCVCSVRDYDRIDHVGTTQHKYGERRRGEQVFHLWQQWRWINRTHYDVTFVIEEQMAYGPIERVRTVTRYYAIGIPRLLELMAAAGFTSCRRMDDIFYQPLLIGQRAN